MLSFVSMATPTFGFLFTRFDLQTQHQYKAGRTRPGGATFPETASVSMRPKTWSTRSPRTSLVTALEDRPRPNWLTFRLTGGRVLLRTLWNGSLAVPFPVLFELGDNATSGAETEDVPEQALLSPHPLPAAAATRGPVIVCPAMFGTVKDYTDLVDGLRQRGHPVLVMPLKFTDWFSASLQLISASLTDECWRGEMRPEVALPFYFKALDAATAQMQREMQAENGVEEPIQLVAHSIGGWAARAYLGQLSPEKRAAYSALVTLGMPQI